MQFNLIFYVFYTALHVSQNKFCLIFVLYVIERISNFNNLNSVRLQLYELIESKVEGDGNCQVGS